MQQCVFLCGCVINEMDRVLGGSQYKLYFMSWIVVLDSCTLLKLSLSTLKNWCKVNRLLLLVTSHQVGIVFIPISVAWLSADRNLQLTSRTAPDQDWFPKIFFRQTCNICLCKRNICLNKCKLLILPWYLIQFMNDSSARTKRLCSGSVWRFSEISK